MRIPALIRKLVLGAMLPMALLAFWHAASMGSVLVPSIGSVARVLAHPMREPPGLDAIPLGRSALISLIRIAAGYGFAVLTAIPLGIWVGRSRTANEIFSPFLSSAMVISPVAWLPVTILIFGLSSPATMLYGAEAWRYGMLDQVRFAVVAVIWMGAFFPIFLNAAAGSRGVRESHLEAVRVLGGRRMQILSKVILPASAPALLTGLRIGGGIAWRALIAAEIFPGTRGGLGYTIAVAQSQAVYEYVFACILIIGAIGLLLDGLLKLAAWPVSHWQPRER